MRTLIPVLAAAAALILATSQEAEAQLGLDFGPQVSYNVETENLGVGARLEVSPVAVPLGFIATGEYVLCDEHDDPLLNAASCSGWEFGASGKYTVSLPGSPLGPYLGAGLTHQRATFEFDAPGDSDGTATDTGFHVIGGLRLGGAFPLGLFLESRYAFLEENQFTIAAGLLF